MECKVSESVKQHTRCPKDYVIIKGRKQSTYKRQCIYDLSFLFYGR